MKAEERNGTTSKSQKLLSPFHKRITHLFTDISCERSTFFQFHGFTQAESVLNYTTHNSLYMCAKEDFSGTHNFAVTSAQHAANARKYQQALNRRGIR